MAEIAVSRPVSVQSSLAVSRSYGAAVFLLIAAIFALKTVHYAHWFGFNGKLTDFDAFTVVSRLIRHGRLSDAYHFRTMMRAQAEAGGSAAFLLWTYPPQFDLLVAPLDRIPWGLAYAVFTGVSLSAYLLLLRRVAGEAFRATLLVTAPALVVTLVCGQNGFVTGALAAWAVLTLRAGRASAGVPLGLLVIKPHLAVPLAMNTLLRGRWGAAAVAASVVLATSIIATLAFGPAVWSSFVHGVGESRLFLTQGFYPLFRMTSIYAALRTFGVTDGAAMVGQGLTALAVLYGLWRLPSRYALGFAALTSGMVSPYAYDYDMPMSAVGLALLLPALARLGRTRELAAIYGLIFFAGLYGLSRSIDSSGLSDFDPAHPPLSLAGPTLAAAVLLIWRVLRRDQASAQEIAHRLYRLDQADPLQLDPVRQG